MAKKSNDTKRKKDKEKKELRKSGAAWEREEKSKKGFHSRQLRISLILFASCLLIFSISLLVWNSSMVPPQQGQQTGIGVPKAAILDGLYASSEDIVFEQELTNLLEHSSEAYAVDVFRRENVTIDLMKNVEGYKILILRVHSAISGDGFLYLFSGENFTKDKYQGDQLLGAVREGIPYNGRNESYLALNAVFLAANKPNGLKDSTIILMGCKGMNDSYSVQRLIEKGVKTYIAWNGDVDLPHSDEATAALVRALYIDNLDVKAALEKTMLEVGPDPYFESEMEYRPLKG
jgi:hypothetical protein